MIRSYITYKSSLSSYKNASMDEINCLLVKLMPDAKFAFVTFEADDFEEGLISYMVFNFVPLSVFVTINEKSDMDKALGEIEKFNMHVRWRYNEPFVRDINDIINKTKTLELELIFRPMQVNKFGQLIE